MLVLILSQTKALGEDVHSKWHQTVLAERSGGCLHQVSVGETRVADEKTAQ